MGWLQGVLFRICVTSVQARLQASDVRYPRTGPCHPFAGSSAFVIVPLALLLCGALSSVPGFWTSEHLLEGQGLAIHR